MGRQVGRIVLPRAMSPNINWQELSDLIYMVLDKLLPFFTETLHPEKHYF